MCKMINYFYNSMQVYFWYYFLSVSININNIILFTEQFINILTYTSYNKIRNNKLLEIIIIMINLFAWGMFRPLLELQYCSGPTAIEVSKKKTQQWLECAYYLWIAIKRANSKLDEINMNLDSS